MAETLLELRRGEGPEDYYDNPYRTGTVPKRNHCIACTREKQAKRNRKE